MHSTCLVAPVSLMMLHGDIAFPTAFNFGLTGLTCPQQTAACHSVLLTVAPSTGFGGPLPQLGQC